MRENASVLACGTQVLQAASVQTGFSDPEPHQFPLFEMKGICLRPHSRK